MNATVAALVVLACAQVEVVHTLEGEDCAPWTKVERLHDSKTSFAPESYVETTKHKSFDLFGGGVVAAFGTETPGPNVSLLHTAPDPGTVRHETPVLLVHGVGTDATLTWNARNIGGEAGLAPYLTERGYRVFAVTFAVSHGDCVSHAVHLAHAVGRVRELTGSKQVDLVTHSMGGLAARAWLGRVDRRIPNGRGAVRRLVMLGTPNEGLDLSFRHPRAYLWFASYGFPAPWIRAGGEDVSARSIFGGAFRGHRQMTADLRGVHPLSEHEQHVAETYLGGSFEGKQAPGLAKAVVEGGRFMRRLNKKRLPRGVEVFLVAGDDNRMRYYDHSNQKRIQVGEYDAPSDGLVFVKSALGERALKKARVTERLTVHVPHFELAYAEPVKEAIDRWLSK